MDVAGYNVGTDRSSGFMGNDESPVEFEENGFHQLKTYYHVKHCYCHAAVETIFNLMIIGFNIRKLYLYRRIQKFERNGIANSGRPEH